MTVTKKGFNGSGVWRRQIHELHVGGSGVGFVVNRSRLRKARSDLTLLSSPNTKVPIKKIRRVASGGHPGTLWSSDRSCTKQQECPCAGFGGNGRNFAACIASGSTVCREIQVTPLTAVAPTPTRGALAEQGAQIGRNAVVGEFVAMETMSDETT